MFELTVPLEQFYNGHTRKIRVTKKALCPSCKGTSGVKVQCALCRGRCMKVVARQIGPGMFQQIQIPCDACNGKGFKIPPGQGCKSCSATGLKKVRKVLSVHIEKGMTHGEKIVFSGEGDETATTSPGDVIVVLKRPHQPHPTFTRTPEGCHLILKRKITLLEALTGFQFRVNHLDDRVLVVKSRPNVIYTRGHIDALREEGMPLRGDVMTRGHLYVEFEVIYPSSLTEHQKRALMDVLGPGPRNEDVKSRQIRMQSTNAQSADAQDESEVEQHMILQSVDLEAERKAYAELLKDSRQPYEEDERDRRENPVACQTQ